MTARMNFGDALGLVGGAGRSEGTDWWNGFVTDRGRGQDRETVVRLCRACHSPIRFLGFTKLFLVWMF